jgi:regulator of protease activity HflC (stomatin/prohibitin superfamily)
MAKSKPLYAEVVDDEGKTHKVNVVTDYLFRGFLESLECRYEILTHPEFDEFSVVLREPYRNATDQMPDMSGAEIVYTNRSHMGFKPAVEYALQQVIADLQAAYAGRIAEARAEKEAAKQAALEAKAAKANAKGAAKQSIDVDRAAAQIRKGGTAKIGKPNGKPAAKPQAKSTGRKAK